MDDEKQKRVTVAAERAYEDGGHVIDAMVDEADALECERLILNGDHRRVAGDRLLAVAKRLESRARELLEKARAGVSQ